MCIQMDTGFESDGVLDQDTHSSALNDKLGGSTSVSSDCYIHVGSPFESSQDCLVQNELQDLDVCQHAQSASCSK